MKRRGFTLIELMVVIAIIIILAAIAIPNYLNMTARAKKSRVQSDMASIATALETYKTDWAQYPIVATPGEPVDGSGGAHQFFDALRGPENLDGTQTAAGAQLNVASGRNAIGEPGPINYMKAGTLNSVKNPMVAGTSVLYFSSADGLRWMLYAADKAASYMYRTDGMSTPSEAGAVPSL